MVETVHPEGRAVDTDRMGLGDQSDLALGRKARERDTQTAELLGDLWAGGFYGLFLYFPWLLRVISLAKKEKTVCKDKGKASPPLGGRKGRGSGAFRTGCHRPAQAWPQLG